MRDSLARAFVDPFYMMARLEPLDQRLCYCWIYAVMAFDQYLAVPKNGQQVGAKQVQFSPFAIHYDGPRAIERVL